jgi:hypothetical protein
MRDSGWIIELAKRADITPPRHGPCPASTTTGLQECRNAGMQEGMQPNVRMYESHARAILGAILPRLGPSTRLVAEMWKALKGRAGEM